MSLRCRTRIEKIDAHRGKGSDFVPRYQGAVSRIIIEGGVLTELYTKAIDHIANTWNLRSGWDYCRQYGGHAAGPDGLTFTDFAACEVWPALRFLGGLFKADVYRPGPLRTVRIPKPKGGHRRLAIPNIIDRTAQRGVLQIIGPLIDPFFDSLSFGGRPRRCHLHALAMAERLTIEQQRWIWIATDLEKAFDTVPLRRLMDVVGARMPNARLVDLFRRIVGDQGKGLPQGGPLSAFMLNLYADHFIDQPWRREFPEIPALRYIDDELLLCRAGDDVSGACSFLEKLGRQSGLRWKPSLGERIADLSKEESMTWLGFEISAAGDRLRFRLPPREEDGGFFDRLDDRLGFAHTLPAPTLCVTPLIFDKIRQAGPAWQDCDTNQFYTDLRSTVEKRGFLELPSYEQVCEEMERALQHWQLIRRSVRTAILHNARDGQTNARR